MTTKLPQHPESMDFDELAYANLRKYFRVGLFTISEERTVIGSREFGVDWIIGNLDQEQHATGVVFYVQSKSTNAVEKEGQISIEIETKNINYLAQRAHPTIIHLYQRDQDRGYWLWFPEWYISNFSPAWRNKQENVSMKFPAEQVLSDESVKQIMEIVTNENFKARVRQATDLFNSLNPDFQFSSPEFIGDGVFTVAQPKHENATFQIIVDEAGNEAIRKVQEEGYTVQFSILSSDAPDPLESVMNFSEERIVTLIPHPDEPLLYKLTFLDENEAILYEEESITFYSVRPGIKEKEYQAKSTKQPVVYVLIEQFDFEANRGTARLNFLCSSNDPGAVKAFLEIYDVFRLSHRSQIVDLKTNKIIVNFESPQLTPVTEFVHRFVNAAYNLKYKFNIPVLVPPQIDEEGLFYVEFAEQILSNKRSSWKIKSEGVRRLLRRKDAPKMLEVYLSQGHLDITQEPDHIELSIGDAKVDLGMLRTVWRVSSINNLEEINRFLSDPSGNEEDTVIFDVEFDEENSFTISVDSSSG